MAERYDEFYVGYEAKSPRRLAARTRLVTAGLLFGGLALALLLTAAQSPFDEGVFEFGIDKDFTGVLVERPHPVLLVSGGANAPLTTYLLTAFGKRGADELVAGLDGRAVRITGSLVYNEQRRMIEVHAVEALERGETEALEALDRPGETSLGTMTLIGEIVDSKCHLGVMKPGRGKAHKACAIRCISGGIPPVLRVEDRAGEVAYLLLVGTDGGAVNRKVLHLVAEPVEVTGEVVRAGDMLVLRADPADYRRR